MKDWTKVIKQVDDYRANGMTVQDACAKVKTAVNSYYFHKSKNGGSAKKAPVTKTKKPAKRPIFTHLPLQAASDEGVVTIIHGVKPADLANVMAGLGLRG